MWKRNGFGRWAPALALLAACAGGEATADGGSVPEAAETAAQQAHIREVVAAGGVVDSILPVGEHLRRFREGLAPVDTLQHASGSAEELVKRLATALSSSDTATLNRLTVNRAEFAYLYYPGSAMSQPPYEAPPELLWGQIIAASDAGARKLLERFGGAPLTATALQCPETRQESGNRLHERCTVRLSAASGRSMEGNLFGTIIERDGRFKFLSLANRI